MARKMYKWVVEIQVSEFWVEDGFDVEAGEAMENMIKGSRLGYARSDEVKCKVLKRPPDEAVAKAMGCPTVEEYLQDRKRRYPHGD